MDARFYNSEEIDLEKLSADLENVFRMQGYEVQHIGNKDQMIVQLKKGGDLIALIGLQTALSVTLQRTSGGTVAMIGQQKWMDKAAVGAVGLIAAPVLWPLMITAGAGAIKQATMANQVLNTIDGLVLQQAPEAHVGPLPTTMQPQFQQYWSPAPQQYSQPQYTSQTPVYTPPTPAYTPPAPVYTPPAPAYTPPAASKLRCPSCNTPYEPGDTFCSGCGRGLTPPKNVCANCKTEIKPGLAFCPSCGASTFQRTQAQPAKPAPVSKPRPVTPVYTPPATPTYTPPATPVYTPPTAPTVSAKPVAPEPYVPPTPKEPPVVPQPTFTLIPGKPKPAVQEPPRAPRVPVYVPSQPSQLAQASQVPASPATPPTPPAPIKTRTADESVAQANTTAWATLIFHNGQEVSLTNERVLVGRYDHDLGGVQPEVDLSSMEGSDTVSRGHATIEHIGSTYQLTDLNSTNLTRVNGKALEANVPTTIGDGDTLQFGKISCTFKIA